MYGTGAAGPDVVRENRNDHAATTAGDHVAPDGARAIEAAVEHDADHGVPSVRRQILRAADEIASRVVNQDVDAAKMAEHSMDHLVDLLRLPDVDLHGQRVESGMPQVRGSVFQVFGIAAADRKVSAKLP